MARQQPVEDQHGCHTCDTDDQEGAYQLAAQAAPLGGPLSPSRSPRTPRVREGCGLGRVPPEPVVGVGGRPTRSIPPLVVEVGTLAGQHPADFTEGDGRFGVAAASLLDIYYGDVLLPPVGVDDWIALTDESLPLAEASTWVFRPTCGGVVIFAGTVRDHSDGRPGVSSLEYEAYRDQVEPRLGALAGAARTRWPGLGRLALLHRVGHMGVGEVSVLVAASAPHRAEAFDAARWCIDTLKSTVPIWKRETWVDGSDWATAASDVGEVPTMGPADG